VNLNLKPFTPSCFTRWSSAIKREESILKAGQAVDVSVETTVYRVTDSIVNEANKHHKYGTA